jgi:hypothetical protein
MNGLILQSGVTAKALSRKDTASVVASGFARMRPCCAMPAIRRRWRARISTRNEVFNHVVKKHSE